jgi:hypothetical protein
MAEQAEFKTFNAKHYPMLKGLKPPYAKKWEATRKKIPYTSAATARAGKSR